MRLVMLGQCPDIIILLEIGKLVIPVIEALEAKSATFSTNIG